MNQGKIILSNNSQFVYSVHDREVANPLGVVVAVLKEYRIFATGEEDTGNVFCRICRTKEGSWYDIDTAELTAARLLLPHLKSAITKVEQEDVFQQSTA